MRSNCSVLATSVLQLFFGVLDRYFLDLQNDLDIRELKASMKDEISEIHPFQAIAI